MKNNPHVIRNAEKTEVATFCEMLSDGLTGSKSGIFAPWKEKEWFRNICLKIRRGLL